MAAPRWRRLVRAVPRAVLLGFGTLLQPKTRPEDHWSASPTAEVVEEAPDADSGAPPSPDDRHRRRGAAHRSDRGPRPS